MSQKKLYYTIKKSIASALPDYSAMEKLCFIIGLQKTHTRVKVAHKMFIFPMIPHNKYCRGGATTPILKGFFTLAPSLIVLSLAKCLLVLLNIHCYLVFLRLFFERVIDHILYQQYFLKNIVFFVRQGTTRNNMYNPRKLCPE